MDMIEQASTIQFWLWCTYILPTGETVPIGQSIDTEQIFEIQTNDDHIDTSLDQKSPTHTDKQQQFYINDWLEVSLMNHDISLCATIIGILSVNNVNNYYPAVNH